MLGSLVVILISSWVGFGEFLSELEVQASDLFGMHALYFMKFHSCNGFMQGHLMLDLDTKYACVFLQVISLDSLLVLLVSVF